jgi:sn-glycerol 3-phosphate transport system permease protein
MPLLISVITSLIGVFFLSYQFKRMGHRPLTGALVGAVAGAAAPLLFMVPLNYCTFEESRKPIDFAFGVLLIAISLLLVLFLTSRAARLFKSGAITGFLAPDHPRGAMRSHWIVPTLLIAPTLIILALFLYYPAFETGRLSTLLVKLGSPRTIFVCVDNFTRLVNDPTYIKSMGVTLAISLAVVILGMSSSLFIATMAYQPVKGASIYRTLLIWPYAISPAVAGIIFLLMFNPTGGIINYILGNLFNIKPGWLNDPNIAPWTVILASVWKSLGFNILFYIAGLQNISKELLEAASIDGANAWQRFIKITFPLLSPITFFLVVTNLTYAFFDTFGTIDYLTPGGGPLNSTNTLMYNIYQVGIQNNDLGKAAAQSIVLFMIVIGITYLQFRTGERRVNYGA